MDRVESPSSQPQEPVPREKKPRCPSCGGSLRPGAVICVNCGYNLKEGRKLKTEIAEAGDSAADASGDDDADQPS